MVSVVDIGRDRGVEFVCSISVCVLNRNKVVASTNRVLRREDEIHPVCRGGNPRDVNSIRCGESRSSRFSGSAKAARIMSINFRVDVPGWVVLPLEPEDSLIYLCPTNPAVERLGCGVYYTVPDFDHTSVGVPAVDVVQSCFW